MKPGAAGLEVLMPVEHLVSSTSPESPQRSAVLSEQQQQLSGARGTA